MFKTDKLVFKQLNKLPLTKRVQIAQRPEGPSILSALTPSQLAELFPRYYQQALPDVGGFRAAMTAAAREKQSEASASLLDRLTKAEKGFEQYVSDKYHTVKQKLGLEPRPPAGLTPEQEAAWNKVMSGAVDVNSDEGKIFSKLSDSQLSSIGLSKSKDNVGRDVFQYAQPEIDRGEAERRLKTSSTSQSKNQFFNDVYNEAYSQAKGQFPHPEVIARLAAVQASHETAYGTKAPGNNYFGIKGAGQSFATHEEIGGRSVGMQQSFRTYGGLSDSVSGYLKLMKGGRYRDVANASTIEEAMNAQGQTGYATDSRYSQKLYAVNSSNGGQVAEVPAGPNGKYSEDQINKMMNQLRDETNVARKQQLANLLTNAGVDTATVQGPTEGGGPTATSTNAWSSVQPIGGQSYCGRGVADLAKQIYGSQHFDGHLGTSYASDLSYGKRGNNVFSNSGFYKQGQSISKDALTPEFIKNLPPGTIVSAGGGRADGAGHIQMKVGNRWASDHWQNDFSFGRLDGRMYKDFVIHYPSEKGLAVMQQKGLVTNVQVSPTALSAPPPPSAEKVSRQAEVEDDKSLSNIRPDEQQYIERTRAEAANKSAEPAPPPSPAAAPTTPTAEVQKPAAPPKPQPARYKFDEQAFIKEVRAKNTGAMFVSDEYIMGETLKGFSSTEGVKYDRKTGTITIADPNSPAIQKVIKDMRDNGLDEKAFLNKMKEEKPAAPPPEKKVAPPPPETKPVEQTPQAPTPAPAPAPEPTPQPQQPQVETKPADTPVVPGASDGGSFTTPNGADFYPLDKKDNMVAVDPKSQQPLFTARNDENINFDSNQNRFDITPAQKVNGNGMGPLTDGGIRNEFDALKHEISSAFASAGKAPQTQTRQIQLPKSDSPNFINNLTNQNKSPYHNPVMERAMARTRMKETGDTLNDHYSGGNTNY